MNDKPADRELTPEEKKKAEEEAAELERSLNEEFSVKMKKREWIVLFNILVSLQYKLGDAKIVNVICDKINAVAAFESHTANGVVTK